MDDFWVRVTWSTSPLVEREGSGCHVQEENWWEVREGHQGRGGVSKGQNTREMAGRSVYEPAWRGPCTQLFAHTLIQVLCEGVLYMGLTLSNGVPSETWVCPIQSGLKPEVSSPCGFAAC